MNNKQRNKQLSSIMDKHYMNANYFKKNKCVYCGSPSNDIDYVPPVEQAYAFGKNFMETNYGAEFLKVPCCNQCNQKILRNKELMTIKERKKEVYKYLCKEKQNTPKWTNDELGELGYTLSTKVIPLQNYQESLGRRIYWAKSKVNIAFDMKKFGYDNF